MREILFRGKREDNGEWIEGYYVYLQYFYVEKKEHLITDETGHSYEVDPETAGQFTGLLDKNGTKIFEGDIVKDMTVYLIHLGYEKQGLEAEGTAETYRHHGAVGVVQYNTEGDVGSCGCCFTQFVGAGFMAANVDLPRCEVLGNIYDNPELMEKTKCSV